MTSRRESIHACVFALLLTLLLGAPSLAFEQPRPTSRFDALTIPEPGAVIGLKAREWDSLPEGHPLRAGWEQFIASQRVAYGGGWSVWLDARSGLPSLAHGSGIAWTAGGGNDLTPSQPATIEELADLARRFVERHPHLLGYWDGQIELDLEASGQTGEVWRVAFRQIVEGVAVQGARYDFHVAHGNLVAFGTYRWAPVRRSTDPALSREQARAALDDYLDLEASEPFVELNPGELRLVPVDPRRARGATWDGPLGEGYEHQLVWRFALRAPGEAPTWVAEVDADSGQVVALFDDTRYETIRGGVFPITNDGDCGNDGCEIAGFPIPYADFSEDGAPDGYAGDQGRYGCSSFFADVNTNLVGQYVRVNDNCGAISESVYCDQPLDLGVSPATDCNVAPGASAGNTRAARTSYYHLDFAKQVARAYLPDNTWLTQRLTDNININSTCNAYWNGSVNFYKSGGGCANTGEISGVMVHEWAHGMDQYDGGGYDNSSESYADVAAIFNSHESCIGRGFRPGVNCSGFGDACLDCTGVREMDWDKRAAHTPATPSGFNDVYCDSGSGPCGKQVHCESHVPSESVFDLATRDLPAMGIDADSAWQIAERLWYLSRDGSGGDIYNCSLPDSDSCGSGSWFHRMRLADDDDGNLSNGTPHAAAIFAAFARHDIACGSASDPEHQNSGACPAIAAPSLSGSAVNGSAELSWTGVSNAGSYLVYRNNLGCDRGQLIIGEVDSSSTSLIDDELANEVPVYYRVQALGTNDACIGRVSNCLELTPRRFAGKVRFMQPVYGCSHAITLQVVDANAGASSVEVSVWSDTEMVPETVVLNETEAGSGVYAGEIMSSSEAATSGDGLVSTTHDDALFVEYLDADDGEGLQNILRSHSAASDCVFPLISGVTESNVTVSSARIDWSTDEPSDSVVVWGETIPPTESSSRSELVTSHQVQLNGLAECTVYYYEVQSSDLAGNTALDDNAGVYFHFETLGDFGEGPQPCHAGQVTIDDPDYSCSDTVSFSVVDLDLNRDPEAVETQTLLVTSTTETQAEEVTVTETGPNTSKFTGSIATSSGEPVSDGVVQVANGDIVTVSYEDADDGTGGTAVSFDTAEIDCVGPVIRSLRVESITNARATIRWSTEEAADTVLEWGTTPALGEVSSAGALVTTHGRTLNQFDFCGEVYFRVSSSDRFGNTTVLDDNGQPFAFLTYDIPGLYWRDNFETGAAGWELDGEWEVGEPLGLGGSSGRADPASAYNNVSVLGHDLSGQGAAAGDYESGIDESARSPVLDATTWVNTKLILHRRLNTEASDEASLWLFAGPGYPLYRSDDANVSDAEFQLMEWDLAGNVDGQPAVHLEFRQQSNSTNEYSGWNVDDVIFKDGSLPDYAPCSDCSWAPSFAGITDIRDKDACAPTGITIEWDEAVAWGSGGAGTYAMYRDTSPDFEPSVDNLIASGIAGLSYDDPTAPTGGLVVFYRVRAENGESCGVGPNNGGLMDANPVIAAGADQISQPSPEEVHDLAVRLVGGAHVRLEWPNALGAASYRVYRSDAPQPDSFGQLDETGELYFDDLGEGATAHSWFYLVSGANACGEEGP
ncbi:MAG: hypothetical protein JSV80_13175 [Acidobacteriota bacterium]|nr:MAG: hypothetical protein JSV80_13175 [Acidobacteriota bacterium]